MVKITIFTFYNNICKNAHIYQILFYIIMFGKNRNKYHNAKYCFLILILDASYIHVTRILHSYYLLTK